MVYIALHSISIEYVYIGGETSRRTRNGVTMAALAGVEHEVLHAVFVGGDSDSCGALVDCLT